MLKLVAKKIIVSCILVIIASFIQSAYAQVAPQANQSLPSQNPTSTSNNPGVTNPVPQPINQQQNSTTTPIQNNIQNQSSWWMKIFQWINGLVPFKSDVISQMTNDNYNNRFLVYQGIGVIIFIILILSTLGFEIFNWVKKMRPWGIIYDSGTKQPIIYATVRLFDSKEKKIMQTVVTDKDGRYNFLVWPGSYYISVIKENFKFPSQNVRGDIDGRFSDLYYGRTIEISKENAYISPDIPIDVVNQVQVAHSKKEFGFTQILEITRLPILILTTLTAIIFVIILKASTAWLLLFIIMFFWMAEIVIAKRKK